MPLILYRRADCHLCELAHEALAHAGAVAEAIDIDTDPVLEERYFLRIPVLRDTQSGSELDWPFDAWAIRQLLLSDGR